MSEEGEKYINRASLHNKYIKFVLKNKVQITTIEASFYTFDRFSECEYSYTAYQTESNNTNGQAVAFFKIKGSNHVVSEHEVIEIPKFYE